MGSRTRLDILESPGRRGRRLAAAVAVSFSAALFALSPAAAAGPGEDLFAATGIRYPDGFDLNTSGEVKGRTAKLSTPEQGPVRFDLTSDRASYTVLTVPRWYWSQLEIQFAQGTEVLVKGSKTVGTDGKLYIVAQELRFPGSDRVVSFRDRKGAPLWTGASSAAQGGSGSTAPRGGMMGPMGSGGMGGMGGGGMTHQGGHR